MGQVLPHLFAVVLFVVGLYLVVTGVPKARENVKQARGIPQTEGIPLLDPGVLKELLASRAGIGVLLILVAVVIEVPGVRDRLLGSGSAGGPTAPADSAAPRSPSP
jgi:hypothetical protein